MQQTQWVADLPGVILFIVGLGGLAGALLLPALWNEDLPWPGADPSDPATWPAPRIALRQELAAMAALRVALEPQHHGTLTADEIAHLGDAMMLQ